MTHRALVVGISSYANLPPLVPVKNEVEEVYAKFVSLGFDAQLCFDLTYSSMSAVITNFFLRVREGDTVVFYFSGHGCQHDDIVLLPSDATEAVPTEHGVFLSKDMFPLVRKCRARLVVIVIDTCRDVNLPRSVTAVTGVVPE